MVSWSGGSDDDLGGSTDSGVSDSESRRIVLELECNELGGSMTVSDIIESTARRIFPIIYNDFRKKSLAKRKEQFWDEIKSKVSGVEEHHKKAIISYASSLHRDFRTTLRNLARDAHGSYSLEPPVQYAHLSTVGPFWKQFVEKASEDDFKARCQLNIDRAAQYRRASVDYARFQEQIILAQKKAGEENFVVTTFDTEEYARKNFDKNRDDPQAFQMLKDAVRTIPILREYELACTRTDDFLAQAMPMEDPGRVLLHCDVFEFAAYWTLVLSQLAETKKDMMSLKQEMRNMNATQMENGMPSSRGSSFHYDFDMGCPDEIQESSHDHFDDPAGDLPEGRVECYFYFGGSTNSGASDSQSRRIAMMAKMKKDRRKRKVNELGGSLILSYLIGSTARRIFPIIYTDFGKKSLAKMKEQFWDEIKSTVSGVEEHYKKAIISDASSLHRDFRTKLRNLARDFDGSYSPEPPVLYAHLNTVGPFWKEFVEQALEDDFKARCQSNIDRAVQYRRASADYARLHEQIFLAQKKTGEENLVVTRSDTMEYAKRNYDKKRDRHALLMLEDAMRTIPILREYEHTNIATNDLLARTMHMERPGRVRDLGFDVIEFAVVWTLVQSETAELKKDMMSLKQEWRNMTGTQMENGTPSSRGPSFNDDFDINDFTDDDQESGHDQFDDSAEDLPESFTAEEEEESLESTDVS